MATSTLDGLAISALTKCYRKNEGCDALLSPAESSALLSSAWASSSQEKLQSLRGCSVQLLRAESARHEADHEAAVEFGRYGVELAVQAIAGGLASEGDEQAQLDQSRTAADGAAALANMVAAAGANKDLALEHGAVDALLGCLEGRSDDELCLQVCRCLGNLTYGWGCDPSSVTTRRLRSALLEREWGPRYCVYMTKRGSERRDID